MKITVREMIEHLQKFDGDLPVMQLRNDPSDFEICNNPQNFGAFYSPISWLPVSIWVEQGERTEVFGESEYYYPNAIEAVIVS